MNRDEFKELMTFTCTCFPNLIGWMQKAPGNTADVWFGVLEDSELQWCMKAVRQMVAGERDVPEYSMLASTIKKAAKSIRWEAGEIGKDTGIEYRFKCLKCQDSGWIPVVSPKNNKQQLREISKREDWQEVLDKEWRTPVYHCLACCNDCVEGSSNHERTGVVLADPERVCVLTHEDTHKERFCKLVDFWCNYKLPNRYIEFDDWSESQP